MRTQQAFGIIIGLALAVASAGSARPGGEAKTNSVELAPGPTNRLEVEITAPAGPVVASGSSIKISGTVTGPDDKPAPQARVSLFPSFSQAEKQTDSEGRFTLTFDPRQAGPVGAAAPIVVARDLARNLAAAMELEESATNATVRLEPA